MPTLSEGENKTFLDVFKTHPHLDKRDNRGKRHELWFVLAGFILSLFRNKDGSLSRMHRGMCNMNEELCKSLGIETRPVVSRSELPLVLQNVDLSWFKVILFDYFGMKLPDSATKWFACDGKELRGTIEKGTTKGEVTVMVISHQERVTVAQDFYNGQKESEIVCVRSLLKDTGLEKQKISLDALHFCPKTTEQIVNAGGTYLIGLKENQSELYHHMKWISTRLKAKAKWLQEEKGHGRVESRKYQAFDVQREDFHDRWQDASLKTLVKVDRKIYNCKKCIFSTETAYYMSNQLITKDNSLEVFQAVRNHWQVEVSNNIRDNTLQEDAMKTLKNAVSRTVSTARTLVMNILETMNVKNIRAQLEKFADNFQDLLTHLRAVNFL